MSLLSPAAAVAVVTVLASLASPALAKVQASCSVTIDYLLNDAPVASYVKGFDVAEGLDFVDDFSSPTRQRVFNAALSRASGPWAVNISYYNDVGVFTAVDLSTSVNLVKGRNETTAGRHVFSTSVGVSGNHQTRYSLSCQRV